VLKLEIAKFFAKISIQINIKSFIFRFFVKNKKTMNLEDIKSRIDKLNRYYEFLSSLRGSVSALDRDVLLMQLREFYEAVLYAEMSKKVEPVQKVETTVPKEKSQIVFAKEERVEKKLEQEPEKTNLPEVVENKPEIKNPAPQIEEKEEIISPVEEKVVPVLETKVVEVEAQNVVKEISKTEENPKIEKVELPIQKDIVAPIVKQEEFEFNPNFEELFVFKQATDLAAKLSESPVSDLSKVLGVNEKLLYTRELFGGDNAKFSESVSFFNKAGYFDKARSFMEYNLIEQYAWLSKEKKTTAREFVKLIRRRYL
jgi:CRISPR/Cas system CSM-associated protein Csm2 small subunit